MDSKNFIMMTVTLIIGVILVAGVLTPVIADSIGSSSDSSDSGVETDISGYDRYAKATDSTNESYFLRFDDSRLYYCHSDPQDDPNIEKYYCSDFYFIGDSWFISEDYVHGGNGEEYIWNSTETPAVINGTDITLMLFDYSGNEYGLHTFSNLIYYPNPDGDFVMPWKYDGVGEEYTLLPLYADNDTEVVSLISVVDSQSFEEICTLIVYGTISDYVSILVLREGNVSSCTWGGYAISDNVIVGGTLICEGNEISISFFGDETIIDDVAYSGSIALMPVSVYSESSDGSDSLSPSLATLLTVIPILVLAGLVIMTVAYFRRV